jgi:transglutaminase-like putative cysteine protease
MKRGLLLFVLLLSSIVCADNEWIYSSNSALVNVNISANIQTTGSVRDLRANLTMYPVSTDFQIVVSQSTEPESENFVFYWHEPEPSISFSVNSQVRTFEKIQPIYSKYSFPVLNIPAEYKKYLLASEIIDSNHPDIVNRATQLASGESDLYRLMHKIAKWVLENVEYDLDPELVYSSQKASWTLQNKRAVCDEMSTLFIALCRAVGIPARFVSGVAYTDDPRFETGWGPHAWAEVYFPEKGWVPVDVTYGQLGDVDLTHIELRKGPDVTASSLSYSWYGGDVAAEPIDIDVALVSTSGEKPAPISIKAKMTEPKVGFGSYNLLEIEMTNLKRYYVPVTLYIGSSDITEVIGKERDFVLLEPEQAKKYYRLVKVKDNLDKNYVYTAYLSAVALRANDTAILEIRNDYEKFSLSEMQTLLQELSQEDEQAISRDIFINCERAAGGNVECNFTNTGNANFENLKICLNQDCRQTELKISQQKSFEFSLGDEAGTVRITGDISKTYSIPALEKPELRIEAESPETAAFDKEFKIKINMTSTGSVPNANLKLYINDELFYEKTLGEITKQQLILTMKGSDLSKGENNIRVEIEFFDPEGNKYTETAELQTELEQLNFWQEIVYFFAQLLRFIKSG